jgi:hypothetical protein
MAVRADNLPLATSSKGPNPRTATYVGARVAMVKTVCLIFAGRGTVGVSNLAFVQPLLSLKSASQIHSGCMSYQSRMHDLPVRDA